MRYYRVRTTPAVLAVEEQETTYPEAQPVTEQERTYPDGQLIPVSLPERYGLAQHCGNCAAYDSLTTLCATYDAEVRANYWCETWREKL